MFEFKANGPENSPRGSRACRRHREALSRPARCPSARISKEAHETLAIAMNRIGGKFENTGEGGEDEARFYSGRANRRSAPQRDQAGGLGAVSV